MNDRVFEVLESRQSHDDAGIGLALVERIVERHGGEMAWSSPTFVTHG